MITAIAIFYVLSGILAYGIYLAHCQGEFSRVAAENYNSDRRAAFFMAIGGFFGLLLCLWGCEWKTYGLMYRRPDDE